ncbi:MAG: VOC family protein [Hyphomonadaceae bacterium]
MSASRISTCLWFNGDPEEAAKHYVSLIPNSRIKSVSRYGPNMPLPEGTPLMVELELDGAAYMLLNGGPQFPQSEAVSIVVACDTQADIDRLWEALTANGGNESQCGWCKDRWGVSWQIVPRQMGAWMTDPDKEKVGRVAAAFMPMKKLDIATLEAAFRG